MTQCIMNFSHGTVPPSVVNADVAVLDPVPVFAKINKDGKLENIRNMK